ncbi:unnamed protein product [Sphagnum compactum]
MIHGLPMGAEAAAGVERDQMADQQKAEIDSSAPFASARAAVSMFGDCIQTGHAHHPQPHSSSHQGYVGHQAPHAPSHNAELEESNAKVKKAIEQEQRMSASLASLKAELKNTMTELAAVKEEYEVTVADVTAEMELELSKAKSLLEAGIQAESKAKESISGLNDALHQVTMEADEKAVALKGRKEAAAAKHELEEVQAHTAMLQSQLKAALMEVEAVKASEAQVISQAKFPTESIGTNAEGKEEAEITLPWEGYEALTRQVQESHEWANKCVLAAIAKVDAVKASEQELLRKLDGTQNEVELIRVALRQAIQKAENAESAKSAIEEMLQCGQGEWRTHAHPGGTNGGQMASPLHVVGDGLVFVNSPTPETLQKSNPLHPLSGGDGHHVASLPVPEGKPLESLGDILQSKTLSAEKAKKGRFSTKLGSYFNRRVT